jgi:hypothetical protein
MTTPTAITTLTTQTRHVPYLTNQQFKLAPTPTPWDALVAGGTPQECEDQLTQLIGRASTWVDSICMQVLAATIDTEQRQAAMNQYGQIIFRPRYHPVIELTDFWSGTAPATMAEMASLAGCSVEPTRIVVMAGGVPVMSSQGPLQFGGGFGPPGYPLFIRYSYGNGYPVTTLAAPAAAGATSVTVGSAIGVLPGFTPVFLRDGAPSEQLNVASVSGNTLTLATPLANNHLTGAAVTGLPLDVEEAVVLAVQALGKMRGNAAIIANSTEPVKVGKDPLGAGGDLATAEQFLVRGDYIRVA